MVFTIIWRFLILFPLKPIKTAAFLLAGLPRQLVTCMHRLHIRPGVRQNLRENHPETQNDGYYGLIIITYNNHTRWCPIVS